MLGLSLLFFLVAIIASVFGYTHLMVGATEIGKILFIIFLILFFISLVLQLLKKMKFTITQNLRGRNDMLGWVLMFLIIALIAGLLGFTGLMVTATEIAKIIFFVFLVLCIVSFVIFLIRRSRLP